MRQTVSQYFQQCDLQQLRNLRDAIDFEYCRRTRGTIDCKELTERQIDIMRYICFSKQEIAEVLCVSASTVQTHLQGIYKRLEVNNRTSALVKALKSEQIRLKEVIIP